MDKVFYCKYLTTDYYCSKDIDLGKSDYCFVLEGRGHLESSPENKCVDYKEK